MNSRFIIKSSDTPEIMIGSNSPTNSLLAIDDHKDDLDLDLDQVSVVNNEEHEGSKSVQKKNDITQSFNFKISSQPSRISVADPRTKYKPSARLPEASGIRPPAITSNKSIQNNDWNTTTKKPISDRASFTFGKSFNDPVIIKDEAKELTITDSLQELDQERLMQLKLRQEEKMRNEKERMEKIENLIQMKKEENKLKQESMNKNDKRSTVNDTLAKKERDLAEQALELKKQTTLMLQMQQKMLMEQRKTEEEKRKLDDQRKIMELENSVQNLQRLITQKQSLGLGSFQKQGFSTTNKSIKDRLGFQKQVENRNSVREVVGDEDQKLKRKRRFMDGRSEDFDTEISKLVVRGSISGRLGKKPYYSCSKLPDELVLTEVTDEGPVKKANMIDRQVKDNKANVDKFEPEEFDEDLNRYECAGELDPELVLTEFSEDGPVEARSLDH